MEPAVGGRSSQWGAWWRWRRTRGLPASSARRASTLWRSPTLTSSCVTRERGRGLSLSAGVRKCLIQTKLQWITCVCVSLFWTLNTPMNQISTYVYIICHMTCMYLRKLLWQVKVELFPENSFGSRNIRWLCNWNMQWWANEFIS